MLVTTATELPRLMTCIGSRLMSDAKLPVDKSKDTTTRDEGIAFHWLNEVVASGEFTIEELTDRKAPNGFYITNDMIDHYNEYVARLPRAARHVEVDTSHSDGILYRINGRADEILFDRATNTLHVIDTKYGHSLVEVENNWSLISHAVGFLLANYDLKSLVERVTFTIYQPRGFHRDGVWRTWSVSQVELEHLHDVIMVKLGNPTDELVTSNHCTKCPVAHSCPANNRAGGNAIDVTDVAFIEQLSGDELSYALYSLETAVKRGKARLDSLRELAVHQIRSGQIVKNYSMQTKLGNEKWRDGVTIDSMKLITGKKLAKDKMLTPNQARNAGVDPKTVAAFSHRPETGMELERISANTIAQKLFEGK